MLYVACQEGAGPTGVGQGLPWKGCETSGLTWGRSSRESKRIQEFLAKLLRGYFDPHAPGKGLALSFLIFPEKEPVKHQPTAPGDGLLTWHFRFCLKRSILIID